MITLAHIAGSFGLEPANLAAIAGMGDVGVDTPLTPQQVKPSTMFPCWFAATDVTKPDAQQIMTQAVKAGARGFGELK